MKLHLPLFLRKALVAAFALFTSQTIMTSYAGEVICSGNENRVGNSGWGYVVGEDENENPTYTPTTNSNPLGNSANYTIVSFLSAKTFKDTVGEDMGTQTELLFQYTTAYYSGAYVEAGASCVKFGQVGTGGNRNAVFRAAAGNTKTLFDINEDFEFSLQNSAVDQATGRTISMQANMDAKIAGGKTFTITARLSNNANCSEIDINGGGTLKYNISCPNVTGLPAGYSNSFNWLIRENSTLDLTAFSNAQLVAGNNGMTTGEVQVTGGKILLADGAQFNNNLVINGATTISTLTAGANLTLTGNMVIGGVEGSGMSVDFLSSNVTLGDSMSFTLGTGTTQVGQTYEIGYTEGTLTANFATFIIDNLGEGQIAVWDNGTAFGLSYLTVTIEEFNGDIYSWTGGSGEWGTASTKNWTINGTTQGVYDNGGIIVIGDSEPGGTLTLTSDVEGFSVTVKGDQDWTIASAANKITGNTALVMEGSGELTISSSNDFAGGTSLKDGTLTLGSDTALGTGGVLVTGGTIKLGADDLTIANTFTVVGGPLNIDTDGKLGTLTGNAGVNVYNITGEGSLTITAPTVSSTIVVAADTLLTINGESSLAGVANAHYLGGEGSLVVNTTGSIGFRQNGFTGTLATSAESTGNIYLYTNGSAAANRFSLELNHTDAATFFVSNSTIASNYASIFLNKISGSGDIKIGAGLDGWSHVTFNIELIENCEWTGKLLSAGGNLGTTMVVGSDAAAESPYTFTMTQGRVDGWAALDNVSKMSLTINNAIVEFAEDANWKGGQIVFGAENAELKYTGNGGATQSVTQAVAGNSSVFRSATEGHGIITVDLNDSGKVLSFAQAAAGFSGKVNILNGTLELVVEDAIGKDAAINLAGGTLNMGGFNLLNTIEVTGAGSALTGVQEFTGTVTLKDGGGLTLNKDYTATVVLETGSTLTMSSTATEIGDGPFFTLDSITGTGTLVFDFMIETYTPGDYVIATAGDWGDKTLADIKIDGVTRSLYTWSYDGDKLILSYGGNDIYWNAGGGISDGTWDGTAENWGLASGGGADRGFENGKMANFIGNGTNSTTITVGSGVVVGDSEGEAASEIEVLRVSNGDFTFDGSKLTLKGGLVVGLTFTPEGTSTENAGKAIFNNEISIGGNIIIKGEESAAIFNVGNIECKDISNKGTLSVNGGSLTARNVTNAGADLFAKSGLTITGGLDNKEGFITVETGDASIATTVGDNGGNIEVKNGNLRLAGGTNAFDQVLVSGSVTCSGVLSIGEDSRLGALEGNGALEIRSEDSTTIIDTTNTTTLANLSGAGKLYMSGNLTLNSASSIGELRVGQGNTLSVTETLNVEGNLHVDNITFINSITTTGPAITVGGSLMTYTGDLSFNIADALITSLGISDGDSYTLMSIAGDEYAGVVTLNGNSIIQIGQSEYEIFNNGDSITITRTFKPEEAHYEKVITMSFNGRAAAHLMDNAVAVFNPQDPNSGMVDLAGLMNEVDVLLEAGNLQAADTLSSALAGAEVATLGAALKGDLNRQMRYLRNRAMSMGLNPNVYHNDLPYYNAWINAEGNNSKLSAENTAPGYKLNSWGGSFGVDANLSSTFTLGAAFTAMYGDLTTESKGYSSAKGNLDTYYLSLVGRAVSGNWTHSFMMTAGKVDAELNRTVDYGTGRYETKGDTDGYALGLMYEVGYTMALNEEGTACWQPVFNVAFSHNSMGGYTEKGSDAALRVADQDNTYVTLGLGARSEIVVGENLYNRASILQLRAMAKLDLGDCYNEAEVSLLKGTKSSKVRSAESGAFGAELGAGFIVPLGQDGGSLFIDASLELRSDYTNMNGTVGYRFTF